MDNNKKIAVGFAYSGKNIGGVRRYIENIEILSHHDVTLYPSNESDREWRKKFNFNVRKDMYPVMKANTQKIIDNNDVFHSNVDPSFIKICEEAQKQGKRWIHTYHNIYMPEDEPSGKLMEWQEEINDIQFRIGGKADTCLCVGEWLVAECTKRKIKSIFVPNFIDISKLDNVVKGNFKTKYNFNNFILFAGDNSVRKNCKECILAAQLLPQYQFVLMGTGLTKQEIEQAHKIKVPPNVITMGPLQHEECLEAMCDCNMLVMNSFTEGLPTVLIETMYYEKPCIIPDGPAWSKHLLTDDSQGYKYPIDDFNNLSQTILKLMLDYKTLPNAKKYVEENFSSDVIIKKLDELYLL